MKNISLILACTFFFFGCGQEKLSKQEVVTKYYVARDMLDFQEIQNLINDSIIVIEGDFVMPYSKESYYEVFKWDSIFRSTYKIVDLKEAEESVTASITHTSIRNTFLQNHELTCQYRLSFESEKISQIESLDCKNADWETWQEKVSSLVDWIRINHPELDGFIYDMTMEGAQNYLKAIELYEANNETFK